jgi:hypothetical protein
MGEWRYSVLKNLILIDQNVLFPKEDCKVLLIFSLYNNNYCFYY